MVVVEELDLPRMWISFDCSGSVKGDEEKVEEGGVSPSRHVYPTNTQLNRMYMGTPAVAGSASLVVLPLTAYYDCSCAVDRITRFCVIV